MAHMFEASQVERPRESFDGGRTWEDAPPIVTDDYASGPVGVGEGAILFDKGDSQGLRLSTDGGQTDQIVFASNAGARPGFHRTVHRRGPDHLSLVTVALEPPRTDVHGGPAVWAPYSLLRSDDGGLSWQILHVP